MSESLAYTVVIEKGPQSYGAYVPDLPGCVAVGETQEEALQQIREAIEFHIEGLREEGLEVPMPRPASQVVEVAAAQPQMTRHSGPVFHRGIASGAEAAGVGPPAARPCVLPPPVAPRPPFALVPAPRSDRR